jgi:proteic killer suppression protein
MYRVELKQVEKELRKLPDFVIRKLQKWILQVEEIGLPEVRRIPGYHDEPLKGKRVGQRSIRLSKGFRAFYIENKSDKTIIVNVIEVNKHEY